MKRAGGGMVSVFPALPGNRLATRCFSAIGNVD